MIILIFVCTKCVYRSAMAKTTYGRGKVFAQTDKEARNNRNGFRRYR